MDEPTQLNPEYDKEVRRRFEAKFRVNEYGCWVWQAHCDKDDYGQFKLDGRADRAHRVSWKIYRGPIEPGYDIDHCCDRAEGGPPIPDRKCVNPDHLEVVTHAENLRRAKSHHVKSSGDFGSITPEVVLGWAEELLAKMEFQVPIAIHIQNAEGAPWRKYKNTFEDGLKDDETKEYALAAFYLYIVQLGVDWNAAAISLLNMNPLSLKRWNNNPDWKEDFARARKRSAIIRDTDFDGVMRDTIERRAVGGDLKAIVSAWKASGERIDRRAGIGKPGAEPARVTGNTFIMLPRGGTLDDAIGVVDAVYRDVTLEHPPEQLPPIAEWEDDDD